MKDQDGGTALPEPAVNFYAKLRYAVAEAYCCRPHPVAWSAPPQKCNYRPQQLQMDHLLPSISREGLAICHIRHCPAGLMPNMGWTRNTEHGMV